MPDIALRPAHVLCIPFIDNSDLDEHGLSDGARQRRLSIYLSRDLTLLALILQTESVLD